ncbi:MAG: DegT/DnrJ/EryC1/StrS family aminotransferase [Caldilineaceae bacterium]|nr:DegT/DnrJ/EryC1/StrS family aminotransferase [Caldilineaceae bacterium]
MINVTKTYLPPIERYVGYLQGIWERNYVTNNGPLVRELEEKLKAFLQVKHLFLVSNGTIALQIAIKALDLQGEIITTPFSYVATTSSIVWEGCHPIFVDIDPETLCLNADLIEGAITPSTTAILPTHVYGNPCDVERIQTIADRHGLKVLYDAAHAFGVQYCGRSLLNFGHISTLSFHATKLFHTIEGGALITSDDALARRIAYMRNFGHRAPEEFWGVGINGKNSEFHAAMGLCVLPEVNDLIARRRTISQLYDKLLHGNGLQRPKALDGTRRNFAYHPVVFSSEESLLCAQAALNREEVFPRRYFFPPLNELPYVMYERLPIAESIARRVLCLPLYPQLSSDDVTRICLIVKSVLREQVRVP